MARHDNGCRGDSNIGVYHPDSLPNARVELNSAMTRMAEKKIITMHESLGSVGILMHVLRSGRRADVDDAGVDVEWSPE